MNELFTKPQLEIWQKVYGLIIKSSTKHSGATFDIVSEETIKAIMEFKDDKDFNKLIVTIYKWAMQIEWFADVEEKDIDVIKTIKDVVADMKNRMNATFEYN